MRIGYYPGCTLKTTAKIFEDTALVSTKALGIELVEPPNWNCCGTVYSLASEDVIHYLAPIRNLIRFQEMGISEVVTLCSICYNTMYRANHLFRENKDKRDIMLSIMDREEAYRGEIELYHLLSYLRDKVGFDRIKEKVVLPLENLKAGAYYGCLLLRPAGVEIDDPESPKIMENLLESLGATPVYFPLQIECCGSFETVNNPELVRGRIKDIVDNARLFGARLIVVSCPLCHFNLDKRQEELAKADSSFVPIPVLYFTELMQIALTGELPDFSSHYIDPGVVISELTGESGAKV